MKLDDDLAIDWPDDEVEIIHVPRLELLSTEDILEAIKDGSPSLWRELKVAVNEEDELEIGHLICKMAWEYKQWLKEQGLDVDSTSTPF